VARIRKKTKHIPQRDLNKAVDSALGEVRGGRGRA